MPSQKGGIRPRWAGVCENVKQDFFCIKQNGSLNRTDAYARTKRNTYPFPLHTISYFKRLLTVCGPVVRAKGLRGSVA